MLSGTLMPVMVALIMSLQGNVDPAVLHALKQVKDPAIVRTLACESRIQQYDDDGGVLKGPIDELGIAQFRPSTWQDMNEKRGTDLDINNALAQINMMEWAFAKGYKHLWVCYNQIYS